MTRPTPPAAGSGTDALIAAGVAVVLGLHAIVWLTSGLATLLHAQRWQPVGGSALTQLVLLWPRHLSHPAMAFPAPSRTALPSTVVLNGLLLAVALTAVAALALLWHLARKVLPAKGSGGMGATATSWGTGAGFANRTDIRRHLSAAAVIARARHTRPTLTAGKQRIRPEQAGLALGTDPHSRQQIWGSVEDSYLYLGPPRSGKGVHLIIPQTLDAPGPVLVTATRPDTLRHTHQLRSRRGPVLAFDPQGLADDIPRLRWAPHRGCDDPLVAIGRARALAAGAQLSTGSTSNGDFWESMTAAVLRAYLHAAALTGRPIGDVLLWASRPTDPTPVRILRSETQAAGGWAEELAAQAGADPRQRDSVWAGVRRAVDSLADPRVLAACSPATGEEFDPGGFLDDNGTLYLLGTTGAQLSVAPLVTALLEDLLDTARKRAASSVGGRLDPPLLLLLDEAANIAPIPSLPNLLADGGGTGITTVAVLQSMAQARARWGEQAADALWDAATTKVIFGGLAHADDLSRISRLAGEIDQPTWTRSTGPSGNSSSVAARRLPALPLEQLRCLPPGQAIVLARHTAPVRVHLTPWWQRPDAKQIRDSLAPHGKEGSS